MSTSYYYISNTDGTKRWLWPAECKKPLLLNFYNATTWKQKLFRAALQAIFSLRIQFLFFKRTNDLPIVAKPDGNDWALFFGTPGPNNKMVLYAMGASERGKFTKIATTVTSKKIIAFESHFLTMLSNQSEVLSFEFPPVYAQNNPTILEIGEITFAKSFSKWNFLHTLFLEDLAKINATSSTIENWNQWAIMSQKISQLDSKDSTSRIPSGLITKLSMLRNEMNKGEKYDFHLAHGDFTPWNSFQTKGNKLGVIDWELAQYSAPKGFDFFHYMIQKGILMDRLPVRDLIFNIHRSGLKQGIFETDEEVSKYLKIYLLFHITYYSSLYSHQQCWHVQVYWQLQTWEDLLNMVIKTWDKRQLFIVDFFKYMANKKYAGLKLAKGRPEDLSEDSDIDLLIEKNDLKTILKWINKNTKVFRLLTRHSSNYTALTIIFMDGSRLHMDLIVELKRKSVVFHNISKFINGAFINENGVKECSARHTAHYIGLFYALNRAEIPKKYKVAADNLLPIQNEYEKLVYAYYNEEPNAYERIKTFVDNDDDNRGFSKLKNKIQYLVDSVKKMFVGNGMVITFSGVDGAGKSTVIDEIKSKLDKKYRKRVVVIRHRPSVLPILSAFKYGKEDAEKRSVNSLPRQGQNTSKFKSILRFSYYYSDYFFGQFYVYFRYVMRGYVVLYDRFYFDMINDGKRSNMVLPKPLTKFAYRFLFKPNFNFFLYATPETILMRKQEMDRDSILELTREYKSLFEKLSRSKASGQYVSINNEILGHTTSEIFQTIGLIY